MLRSLMRCLFLMVVTLLAALAPLTAGLTEGRLESAMKQAASKGRLVAFFFEQGYYAPNCPKCIVVVNAANKAMKSAIPRKYTQLLTIEAKDTRGLDKLPECVQNEMKSQGRPLVVLTDASGAEVVASLKGSPDRNQAEAFEQKTAEAAGK